jgi:hypothetical protein
MAEHSLRWGFVRSREQTSGMEGPPARVASQEKGAAMTNRIHVSGDACVTGQLARDDHLDDLDCPRRKGHCLKGGGEALAGGIAG